ncbi:hypothetical protein L596_011262 [Steinernema carpocapsae]|uniref:Uncharacterized protein n=1 Tax=Steinernema carpocapsae TaxID=34508 RepID=A0A4V6A4H6_STECR|nr:hypothetical protein L596_011262 [Steinernema carpocapsae]
MKIWSGAMKTLGDGLERETDKDGVRGDFRWIARGHPSNEEAMASHLNCQVFSLDKAGDRGVLGYIQSVLM